MSLLAGISAPPAADAATHGSRLALGRLAQRRPGGAADLLVPVALHVENVQQLGALSAHVLPQEFDTAALQSRVQRLGHQLFQQAVLLENAQQPAGQLAAAQRAVAPLVI